MIDEPTNINWQNINYPKWKKNLRVIVAIFIGILIIGCSFGIAILNKYTQKNLEEKYNPNIDCTKFPPISYKAAYEEYIDDDISSKYKSKTYCYCYNKLLTDGYTAAKDFIFTEINQKPCEPWLNQYILYNGITILFIITIAAVNIFVVLFLQNITKYEKNKTLTEDMTSNMWKNFALQFINILVVVVIVNMRINAVYNWKDNFPLFTGKFDDLEPAWYYNVGVTIVNIINLDFYYASKYGNTSFESSYHIPYRSM
jgi:hypothetical protein